VESPRINSRKTPSLLSLSLKVEFQYRIAGKRNFIKDEFKIPLLLFFVHKTLNPHHIFQIEHYAALSKNCFSASQTFVLCETLGDCSSCNIQDLPLKIFALKSTEVKQNFEISNDILEKLDRAIKNAINALPEPNLIKEPEPDKPKKQNKTTPRKTHRTYKRKK
jgi:hypothetical protein